MKKQLPTADISKELSESVFFPKPAEEQATTVASNHDTVIPRHHDTMTPPNDQATPVASYSSSKQPRHHDTMTPASLETIRKAVKEFGKEAATHRFTEAEKRTIADVVYTYERQGYRTSENEITRIAIHWLLQDYQLYGVQSVLARLLESLHK